MNNSKYFKDLFESMPDYKKNSFNIVFNTE